MTEGILLRRMQDDPYLTDVGCLVFDEFHERGLDGDLALAMARRVQREVRPELAIVVMSATLDVDRIATWPGIRGSERAGRSFPVSAPPPARGRSRSRRIFEAVQEALATAGGDVLVFLPGVGEIRRSRRASRARAAVPTSPCSTAISAEVRGGAASGGPRRLVSPRMSSPPSVEGVTAVGVAGSSARCVTIPPSASIACELRPDLARLADQRWPAGRSAPGVCLRLGRDGAPALVRSTSRGPARGSAAAVLGSCVGRVIRAHSRGSRRRSRPRALPRAPSHTRRA